MQSKKEFPFDVAGHPGGPSAGNPPGFGPGGSEPDHYEDDSDLRVVRDIPYVETGESLQVLDIYLPQQDAFDTFIFFHGGGFNAGDKKEAVPIARYLNRQGVAMVSANYRVGQDVQWPAYIEDAAAAVAWVMEHMKEYGRCEKFYVGGSSAGGYLSQMLCFDRRYLGAHGIDPTDVAGYIHDSGQPTAHFASLAAKGIDPSRVIVDESAPLYFVGVDEKYSPMMILVSDNDLGTRQEQTQLLVATLKSFDVPEEDLVFRVMHGGHWQHTFAKDENGDSVLGKMISDFIKSRRKPF